MSAKTKTATPTAHIILDEQGRARIDGTGYKVIDVVLEKVAWLLSSEAIQRQHPDLTLAQIHAALSYYYDHQEAIDAEIERDNKLAEEMMAQAPPSPTRKELEQRLAAMKAKSP